MRLYGGSGVGRSIEESYELGGEDGIETDDEERGEVGRLPECGGQEAVVKGTNDKAYGFAFAAFRASALHT